MFDVKSRSLWIEKSIQMAWSQKTYLGVGSFFLCESWNSHRTTISSKAILTADPHNKRIQISKFHLLDFANNKIIECYATDMCLDEGEQSIRASESWKYEDKHRSQIDELLIIPSKLSSLARLSFKFHPLVYKIIICWFKRQK